MANSGTTNFVDRLLMKLDGAIAPIWNRLFLTIDQPLEKAVLLRCLQQLIQEVPRLRSLWNPNSQQWEEQPYHSIQSVINITYTLNLLPIDECIKQRLTNQDNIAHNLPVRLSFAAVQERHQSAFLLSVELHHGAGDGRSLLLITKRFWQILDHIQQTNSLPPLTINSPQLTDKLIIRQLIKRPGHLITLMKSKNKQLARRASPLQHHATQTGIPTLLSHRIDSRLPGKHKLSSLFYAAVLAAIVQLEAPQADKLIRLRIPVDVRQRFNLSPESFGNACSAMIIELQLNDLRVLFAANPQSLIPAIEAKIKEQLQSDSYIANAMECLLVSRLATKASMQAAASTELLGKRRSSTLVITFLGELNSFITPPHPIDLLQVRSHTPVWGLNGFLYNGYMHINLSCFDGIWPKHIQEQFTNYLISFLTNGSTMEGTKK